MLRTSRALPSVLVALIALRTLVPVGYMLSLPAAGGGFGLALALCPTQNPGLDLSLLRDGSGASHLHHHHHAPPADGESALSVGVGCGDWLTSAGPALAAAAPVLALPPVAPANDAPDALPPPAQAAWRHALPRAPPTLG